MTKMAILSTLLAPLWLINSATAQADSWQPAWVSDKLLNPESVLYSQEKHLLFVSQQHLDGQKGEASIALLTPQGAVIEQHWVSGLNEPKGMAVVDNTLFVSDVKSLVEIDIEQAKVIRRHQPQGAQFLNDVATDAKGNVYVSDMFTSSIYRLPPKGKIDLWLQGPELENPNGLLIQGDNLVISAWGAFSNGKPLEAPAGHLLKVSLVDKRITRLSQQALGNLDGLVPYSSDEYLLSDWVAGKVMRYSLSEGVHELIDTERSSGDIAYLPELGLLLVPMALQGELGVRRDGSYYTRIEWSNATLNTPLYWANNIHDGDTARNGGSWGAPTMGPAELVMSFFGERQVIQRIRLFHNVGASISPLDELAKRIKLFVSDDVNLQRIGDLDATLENFDWQLIVDSKLAQREGWFEFTLDAPVEARYVRVQLVENFGTPEDRAFTETNELQFFAQ